MEVIIIHYTLHRLY